MRKKTRINQTCRAVDKTMEHLMGAVAQCGFDYGEAFIRRNQKRIYADIRSIVWHIYRNETAASATKIARAYDWNRCTIISAIQKAHDLKEYDRAFCDLYDSIYGYYMALESNASEEYEQPRKD